MFNYECYKKKGNTVTQQISSQHDQSHRPQTQPSSLICSGTVLGTCIDGFLFGACCRLPKVTEAAGDVEEEEEEESETVDNQDDEDEIDLVLESELSEEDVTPPTVLSDLLSKSDLSDSEKDDIAVSLTETSHDDLEDPDLLDSLGSNLTTKLSTQYHYFLAKVE